MPNGFNFSSIPLPEGDTMQTTLDEETLAIWCSVSFCHRCVIVSCSASLLSPQSHLSRHDA